MSRAIFLAGTVPLLFVLVTAGGCGDDETPDSARSATPDAGPGATGAGGGIEAGGPRANFGRACERPEDCGVELLCLTADSRSLTRGGPPRGLCTASCDSDPEVCSQYADDARCVQFGRRSYCMEACEFGSAVIGAFDREKCHGRTEFACKPTLVNTRVTCDGDSDCDDDQRCDGTCWAQTPTCMPQCNSGSDCDSGLFCDPRTGECVRDVPSGLALGQRCDVAPSTDTCRGSCGLIDRPDGGRCDETCTIGAFPACGQDANPSSFGCALAASPQASFGDMGYCARLCDCTADCASGLECVVSGFSYLQRPGFCATANAGVAVRSSCVDMGSGGSGGSAVTTSTGGSGGTLGTGGSGAATGNAGEGGASAEGGAAGAVQAIGAGAL